MKRQAGCGLTGVLLGVVVVLAVGVSVGCRSEEPGPAQPALSPAAARLERGRYLTEHVSLCFDCHSRVDWNTPGGLVVAGTKGGGGPFPETNLPFPLNVPNISPDRETGAGTWTDEQLARAIREGVGHDGRVLFPGMPYPMFHQMSDADLATVIAYLRSIPPVHHEVQKTPVPAELQQTLKPMPVTAPVPPPDFSDPVKRGAYLVTIGLCNDCHTPWDEKGQPMMQFFLAGGRPLVGDWGVRASANITPDASGIAYYDEKLFLQVMRTGKVGARQLNPIMRWSSYRGMTDEDLKAIFAYLRTLKPVQHKVDNTEPPTYCKLCGQKHGYGDRN